MFDVHTAVDEIKKAAESGQGVVDSAVATLETFLDHLDQAFNSGDPNAAKQLASAVRQERHEIAKKISE